MGGGKSEDRRRSLEINRCRSNRFGHGMLRV